MSTAVPLRARLLVVDDDPKIRAFLTQGLSESGYECESAADGESALNMLRNSAFDLALLDVMMPGLQGWDVLEILREEGRDVPVIWVTARDALDERIKGLAMGGDDYVVKPFAFEELLARIGAVLRRRRKSPRVNVADLVIEPVDRTVTRAGRPLDLTPREFDLLRRLASQPGEVLSRDELLRTVWDIAFDPGTNMVDVHIRRLRKKVDLPFDRALIHTERGQGYVLEDRGPT